MSFESEYKLEDVPATRVAVDKIDETFRSSTIGEWVFFFRLCVSDNAGNRDIALSVLASRPQHRHCAS